MQNAATSLPWWEALAQDARGNVHHARHGNGVETMQVHEADTGRVASIYSATTNDVIQDLSFQYDLIGSLTQRSDSRQGLVETFQYDTLNRVVQINTTTLADPASTSLIVPASMWVGTNTEVSLTYNALGNIMSKSDVGTYTYGESHAACGTGPAGPHAVSSVVGTKNATYCYNARGDTLTGDGRTMTWAAFGKPLTMIKGAATVAFTYGPDRGRFKRVDTDNTGITTTHYVGGKAYENINRNGSIERKHYLPGGAVFTDYQTAGLSKTRYLHKDHLGSVDAITDEAGIVVERMSFDAFGKRRDPDWVPVNDPTGYLSPDTTRGYTGHEQIDPAR